MASLFNLDCPSAPVQKRSSSSDPDTLSSATSTQAKKAKAAQSTAKPNAKSIQKSPRRSNAKGEGWSAERRLRLWGAFNACAEIKWEDVAVKVG
jgi:hypothetical protein